MLTCEQALELISAQLDGALTAEEAGALDEHLAQCPACRALRADLSTLHQLLPTLAEEPPAGLKDDIMKAVHASKCTPFHTGKRQWRWRSWASLAAVLVLVLVGGQAVHLWSPPDSSGSVPRANLAGLTGAASLADMIVNFFTTSIWICGWASTAARTRSTEGESPCFTIISVSPCSSARVSPFRPARGCPRGTAMQWRYSPRGRKLQRSSH